MPSFTEVRRRTLGAVVVLALFAPGVPASGQQPAKLIEQPSDVDIARALDRVKADPNLGGEHTIKTLRWKQSENAAPSQIPEWLTWFVGLFRWVDQSARVLVWVTVIGLSLLLVIYIVRLVRARTVPGMMEAFVPPTHVRDLDIRPESLPAEIGAAARALWDRGDHRAALALLYRGMLSRLAHVHRVPIRDSSTEGDCLTMVNGRLPPRKHDYTVLLVRVWQRFVYGGEQVDPSTVYALCHDFSSSLDRAAALDADVRGSTA